MSFFYNSFDHNVIVTDPDKIKEIKDALRSPPMGFVDVIPCTQTNEELDAVLETIKRCFSEHKLNDKSKE